MKTFRIAATLALLAALGLPTGSVRASEEVTPQQCHPWPDCQPDPPHNWAAQFVSQTVPVSMYAGQSYPVSIKMKNVGDISWSTSYSLVSFNPYENTTWGVGKVLLLAQTGVGQTATFNFNVTAPATPGNYDFQWQMDRGTPFGSLTTKLVINVIPVPVDASQYVSQSIPTAMTTGQAYPINIKLKNTGNTTWTSAASYKLALLTPGTYAAWGIGNRFNLAASVAPGGTATFTANITPSAAGGASFQFRMIKGATLFGASTPAVAVTAQDPPPPPLLGVRTGYDALGRVRGIQQDSELGVLTTTTTYLNNINGPYTLVTNPRGFQTRTWYQAYDQPSQDAPTTILYPESAVTVIGRDVFGKPITLTRRNSDSTQAATRRYYYDGNQQLCRTAEPETYSTVFSYDAAGNLAWSAAGLNYSLATACYQTQAQASGRRVDRTYDDRNRLHTLSFPDGLGNQTWTYTPDGLPLQTTVYNGPGLTDPVTTAYSYNHRRMLNGQGETVSQPGWYAWGLGYGYNANGHLASHSYPTGLTVTYAPNALGQPTQVGTYATGVSYYPNGAVKQFTYGHGIVHTMAQNARQLPERSADTYGSTKFLDDSYDYDANGNVAAISDALTGHRGDRTMTYDDADRLTDVMSPMYGATGAHYSYDVLDNLTGVNISGTVPRDHYYCYDAANRLTNLKTGSCAGTSVIGLGYDAQGNLNNKNGTNYLFDYGNRLRSVEATESYRYDALGRRVQTTRSADQSRRVWQYSQGGQLMFGWKEAPSETTQQYLYLGGSLVAIVDRDWPAQTVNSVRYQHTDALGSPVAVTDANRVVIEKNEYEPFGKVINHPLKDGPGYTGHVADAATGMIYMQKRFYDDDIGRFISRDPVPVNPSNGANFNGYSYAANNPYKFTDPDGRDCVSTDKKTSCTVPYKAPGIPTTISFPTPAGVSGTQQSSSPLQHQYKYTTAHNKSDGSVQKAMVNDPTPGRNDKPATPTGTLNKATPDGPRGVLAQAGALLGNDPSSPVKSYSATDGNNNTWTINVTQPGHGLHFGYVLRGSVGGQAMSIGEGWAPAQALGGASDMLINDVWKDHNQRNIDDAR